MVVARAILYDQQSELRHTRIIPLLSTAKPAAVLPLSIPYICCHRCAFLAREPQVQQQQGSSVASLPAWAVRCPPRIPTPPPANPALPKYLVLSTLSMLCMLTWMQHYLGPVKPPLAHAGRQQLVPAAQHLLDLRPLQQAPDLHDVLIPARGWDSGLCQPVWRGLGCQGAERGNCSRHGKHWRGCRVLGGGAWCAGGHVREAASQHAPRFDDGPDSPHLLYKLPAAALRLDAAKQFGPHSLCSLPPAP